MRLISFHLHSLSFLKSVKSDSLLAAEYIAKELCRAIWNVKVGYDPTACAHMIASMQWQETATGDQSDPTVKKLCP
jgi:hypothetical protein